MKVQLDVDKIAKRLGAERRGEVSAKGGYFGALQLVADIQDRFQVPPGGGRATDPSWNVRRQIPMTDKTLKQLEGLVQRIKLQGKLDVGPMQLAALILERTTAELTEEDVKELVIRPRSKERL